MTVRMNRIAPRLAALGGLVAIACSGCKSEEVATSPGGMMPPAMAGVKDPAKQVAAREEKLPWISSGAGAGVAANPSDPSTLDR